MKNSSNVDTRVINTDAPVRNDSKPRQPNDRDESPDHLSVEPKQPIKQAYDDLERGLVDTDLRGKHGTRANKEVNTLMERDRKKKDSPPHH
jgi:hypothetical protein